MRTVQCEFIERHARQRGLPGFLHRGDAGGGSLGMRHDAAARGHDQIGRAQALIGRRRLARGLRGDEISMVGRIVAVADAFDAMTSDRPYRKRMSNEEAIARLQAAAGSKFDRNVVNALINVYHSNSLRQLFQSGALEGARRESAFIIRD